MKLQILNKSKIKTEFTIRTIWQDIHSGMDRLYYEVPSDEDGKGTFLPLDSIICWRVVND